MGLQDVRRKSDQANRLAPTTRPLVPPDPSLLVALFQYPSRRHNNPKGPFPPQPLKTIRACFKNLAGDLGIPYQNLINFYLRDCAFSHRKPALKWAA